MVMFIYIFKFIMNIIYAIFKLKPVNSKKIIMLSRQRNTPSINFNLLKEELKRQDPDIKIIICSKRMEKTPIGLIKYFFHLIYEMWHLADSSVAVLETYSIPICILKHKKKLVVIQMWHAMGALKKFGYSILDQEEGSNKTLAKAMNMHKNYDYVMTSGKKCIPAFSEAFNIDKNKIFVNPLPVVDQITSNKYQEKIKEDLLKEYPILSKKKNILYSPTFRKTRTTNKYIKKLIDEVDFKKYNLIIKLHPNSKVRIKDERVIIDNKHTTIKFAFLSDYIITDYSAIVFELALLDKPIYFYNYDYDNYMKTRNFYMDYMQEMPGLITNNPKDIINSIKKNDYDYKKLNKFKKEYVDIPKKGCTYTLSKFILDKLK